MTIDYAAGGALVEAYGRAWEGHDGDGLVALFTDDAEYHGSPFDAPLVGHNALRSFLLESATRQRDVAFTIERHWVSGPTVLAAWHASWVGPADGAVNRSAGFLTAEVAEDGRIRRFREWWMMAPRSAAG
jgi:ketosteroid isomerase-like protein